jgi:hypothetical protein
MSDDKKIIDTGKFEVKDIAPASEVKVVFFSNGKLGTPTELNFKDYTARHINDLSLANEDNMIESQVKVINELCHEKYDVTQCVQDEFLQILMTILLNYWRTTIDVPWMCECQNKIKDEDARKYEMYTLDLKTVNIDPIPDIVHEPIIIDDGKHKTQWKFIRVGDILYAKDSVKKKYASEQWKIDNLKLSGVDKDTLIRMKEEKQIELDKLKFKDLITLTRAQCLVAVDEMPIKKEEKEKVMLDTIDPSVVNAIFDRMNKVKMGINKDYEIECPECKSRSVRRLLFQSTLFIPTNVTREFRKPLIFSGI